MDQTYLYEVRPHRIITGIHGVPYIRSPRSVYLTKEEVLICLQKGSVYRRFANLDKLERVTVTNVDRLHNENFIPEEEWKGAPVVEDAPEATEDDNMDQSGEKETSEKEPVPPVVEESKVDETTPDEVTEEAVEESAEEVAEEESDDSVVEEKADEVPQQNNNNVQFKNHHKKHKK